MISNILELSKLFSSCKFVGSGCLILQLMPLQSLQLAFGSSFCCNKCTVPTFISNACRFDCSFVSPCLVNERCTLSTHPKKKKKRGRKEKGILYHSVNPSSGVSDRV